MKEALRFKAIIGIIFLFSNASLMAQGCIETECQKSIPYEFPDSVWYVPSSIILMDKQDRKPLPDSSFHIVNRKLIFHHPDLPDTVILQYRFLPLQLNTYKFRNDSSQHQYGSIPEYVLESLHPSIKNDWWDQKELSYSGNYQRGISLGTSQSLIVNSALNLQLNGELGDGIQLVGAISDNQIPIQPEGNTRQIQDFDRLFLKISKANTSLTAGDFEISRPKGYFMNYYKKSQGGLLDHTHRLGQWNIAHKMSFAISRGKFNRIMIPIVNGNQGPYRLRGRDGENFIIILAGTEKVYIDGVLVNRGDESDYVMDYNLGEIRFTPRRLVTDQMRIFIEFEYSDQNYLRSLSTYSIKAERKSWSLYLNMFREADSKKSALETDQDSVDRQILAASGDDPKLAVRSSVRKSGTDFNSTRIYYEWKDSVVMIMGIMRSFRILKFVSDPDSNALQANFTDLGIKKGTYQLSLTNANGRVYEWVGLDPITGDPIGNYEPSTQIIAPRDQWLNTIGVRYENQKKSLPGFQMEIAQSYLDLNRISAKDDQDNFGLASRSEFWSPIWQYRSIKMNVKGFYEWKNDRFLAINPYRNQEFNRDWNIENQFSQQDHFYGTQLSLDLCKNIHTEYLFTAFQRPSDYNGFKNELKTSWKDSIQELKILYNGLLTESNIDATEFLRPGVTYQRKIFKHWQTFGAASIERNQRRLNQLDSLLPSSFQFYVVSAGLRFTGKVTNKFQLELRRRKDYRNEENLFKDFSISDELNLLANIKTRHFGSWDLSITGRRISYSDSRLEDSIGQYNLLSQLEHLVGFKKNAVRFRTLYSVQSGAEPRLEFVFEERRPGDGEYIYIDFNKDGVRQIQEYVYAPDVDTARFVRIQVFNSEYIQAYQSQINHSLLFDLNKIFDRKSSDHFLRKLSFEAIVRYQAKISPDAKWYQQINPFFQSDFDEINISYQRFIQQQFFINRANPRYEIVNSWSRWSTRQLLTFGNDDREAAELISKTRITFFENIDLNIAGNYKDEFRSAGNYSLQNYRLISYRYEIGNMVRVRKNIRTQIAYTFKTSMEIENQKEKAEIHQFSINANLFLRKRISLRTEVKWFEIKYSGQPGTAVEFIVLEGFKNGSNASVDFGFEFKINDKLSTQWNYSMRKAAHSEAVHTGRVTVRAYF